MIYAQHARVFYYDSMSSAFYRRALDKICWELARALSQPYQVVCVNSPQQFDSFSCGAFVCMKFWRRVDDTVTRDSTPRSMTALRYGIAKVILDMLLA